LPDIYNQFSLIICDEGHLIDDEGRGLSYELLLSKFRANSNVDSPKKFIFLSAIIPNIEHINEWLDGDANTIVKSEYRPTQLEYAFLKNMQNRNFMLDMNPQMEKPYSYQLYNFLTRNDFQFINAVTQRPNTYRHSSFKSKSVATALKSIITGTVALFTPQKKGDRGVIGLAEETIKQIEILDLPKPQNYSNPEKIKKLAEHFKRIFGEEYLLSRLVNHGVLFHHGDLPQDIRELIEESIRNSEVRLVICTNTLAEGVNLPIKVIVIHSAKRYNPKSEEWVSIKIRDLKNLVGRAGRAGKETKGLVIVTNPADEQTIFDVINNEKNEDSNGVLYFIIDEITKLVTRRQLTLDNDFLENQNEQFLELIDSIDISLINLLSEEVEEQELETQIRLLMQKTYAYFQASDKEKETLENLFQLRGKKLKFYIKSDEFKLMKRSHSNIRIYEQVKAGINLDDAIWTNTNNPLKDEWINQIFDLLFSFPQFTFKINEFEEINRIELTKETLKKIVILWLSGSWYKDISKETNIEVDKLLNIFTYIIHSLIQIYSSKIIRIVFNLLEESNKEISEEIFNWPNYLNYGLKDKYELDLVEIGFDDREVIICLSDWMKINHLQYDSLRELKKLVRDNNEKITKELENKLSVISFEKLKKSFYS
ncbi:DEAD/DEAH box helicase, partial [Bacillus sp. AFS001701]|uniref:helicase-related protein n=1 Tax=Bacillus sp. AFS001701 TaxID=2033480 RepID=UPI000BFAD688